MTPLQPWIAVESNDSVICAHCTCKAGLGEACSHIAAVLLAIEAQTQAAKNTSCTSKPCAWLPPTMKNIGFAEIADIEFTKPNMKQKRLMTGCYVDADDKSTSKSVRSDLSKVPIPKPTETELNSFY